MSLRTGNPVVQSAAWRISLWGTLAFALGTMIVFVMLHRFVEHDIQQRSDAWLAGEVDVLGDVAERTPKDRLYSRVVSEVAELASKEVPYKLRTSSLENEEVFFLQVSRNGAMETWVGSGDGRATLNSVLALGNTSDEPQDVRVDGFKIPFRVAAVRIADGSRIFLGLSERDELRVLHALRFRFFCEWFIIVLLGFAIIFAVTRRMLGDVRRITEAASGIGREDLSRRVPTNDRRDEVSHLALTLNGMLDRIEQSVHQLHTITDSLAHDLRSPLTAIRGKLEVALTGDIRMEQAEPIVSAIEELDRLTNFLNSTLDVAEAKADALRLSIAEVDLDEVVRILVDLYEPTLTERGLRLELRSPHKVKIRADAALLHRVIANLLDNEVKHLPAACTIFLTVTSDGAEASLTVADDGPGFAPGIVDRIFEQRVKGEQSRGYGLGLAFVQAVVRAHGGSVHAANVPTGGAMLSLTWPAAHPEDAEAGRTDQGKALQTA